MHKQTILRVSLKIYTTLLAATTVFCIQTLTHYPKNVVLIFILVLIGLIVVSNNIRIANSKTDLKLAHLLKIFDLKHLLKEFLKLELSSPTVVAVFNLYLAIILITILFRLPLLD